MIRKKVRRRGKCQICGGRTERLRTFYQTVSPFNTNGGPVEIEAAVEAEAAAWHPEPAFFNHYLCEDGAA